MPIVISESLVLSGLEGAGFDTPVIGYHNVVTAANIAADSADPNFPATNLANPSTNLFWTSQSAVAQNIVFTLDYVGDVDYIGIAGHNLGSNQVPITVNGRALTTDPWSQLIPNQLLPDDRPIIFQFDPQGLAQVQLALGSSLDLPQIAVVYIGKLITMERGVTDGGSSSSSGFTPITYGRVRNVVNGRSESGNFVGRIVTGSATESVAVFNSLSPTFYRSVLEPFIQVCAFTPFFFAWRPQTFPLETGYAWLTNDPQPSFDIHGYVAIEFDMVGITQ